MKRPLGVSILAVLTIIGGILLIGFGIALATMPSFLEGYVGLDGREITTGEQDDSGAFALLIVGAIIGGAFTIFGIIEVIFGFATWRGKKWAWKANVISSIIGIVSAVASVILGDDSAVGSIAISAIILYYLSRRDVKVFFGRVPNSLNPTP